MAGVVGKVRRSPVAANAERIFTQEYRGRATSSVETRFIQFLNKKPRTAEEWAEYRAVVKTLQKRFETKSKTNKGLLKFFD